MLFAVDPDSINKKATLITGFTGFGNVGYIVMNHLAESLPLKSISFWGSSSWMHRGRLEAPITIYTNNEESLYFLVPRIPLPVTAAPHQFWDMMMAQIIDWGLERYVFIGGLREVTRRPGDHKWAAYVTTPEYETEYKIHTTIGEDLAMIGPLSSILTHGTSKKQKVIALLMYCSEEEDEFASETAILELNKLLDVQFPGAPLKHFDNSFVPMMRFVSEDGVERVYDDNEDDDLPDDFGYNIDELR